MFKKDDFLTTTSAGTLGFMSLRAAALQAADTAAATADDEVGDGPSEEVETALFTVVGIGSSADIFAAVAACRGAVKLATDEWKLAVEELRANGGGVTVVHSATSELAAAQVPVADILFARGYSRSGMPGSEHFLAPLHSTISLLQRLRSEDGDRRTRAVIAYGPDKMMAPATDEERIAAIDRFEDQDYQVVMLRVADGGGSVPQTKSFTYIVAVQDLDLDKIRHLLVDKTGAHPLARMLKRHPKPQQDNVTLVDLQMPAGPQRSWQDQADRDDDRTVYDRPEVTEKYRARALTKTREQIEAAVESTRRDGTTVVLTGYNTGRAFRAYPDHQRTAPYTGPGGGSSQMVMLVISNGTVRSRKLSRREMKRIAGRGDTFVFPGSWTQAHRSTCEAVPSAFHVEVLRQVVLPLLGLGPVRPGSGGPGGKNHRRTAPEPKKTATVSSAGAIRAVATTVRTARRLLGPAAPPANDNVHAPAPVIDRLAAADAVAAAVAVRGAEAFRLLRFRRIGRPLTVMEFFAGGGDFREGTRRATGVWQSNGAQDIDKYKVAAYADRHGEDGIERKDILHATADDIPPGTEVLFFSPPCQSYSSAGNEKGTDDIRGQLLFQPVRLTEELKSAGRPPQIVIVENVRGLLTANKGRAFRRLVARMVRLGYRFAPMLINAKWWVPQNRERVFLVFIRADLPIPQDLMGEPHKVWHPKSVRKAVEQLPADIAEAVLWLQMPLPTGPRPSLAAIIQDDVPAAFWRSAAWVRQQMVAKAKEKHAKRIVALKKKSQTSDRPIVVPFTCRGRGTELTRFKDLAPCLSGAGGDSSKQRLAIFWRGRLRVRDYTPCEQSGLMGRQDVIVLRSKDRTYRTTCEGLAVPVVMHLLDTVIGPILMLSRVQRALLHEQAAQAAPKGATPRSA